MKKQKTQFDITFRYINDKIINQKIDEKIKEINADKRKQIEKYEREVKDLYAIKKYDDEFLQWGEFRVSHWDHLMLYQKNQHDRTCTFCTFNGRVALIPFSTSETGQTIKADRTFLVCDSCAMLVGTFIRCDVYNEMKKKCDFYDEFLAKEEQIELNVQEDKKRKIVDE